MLATTMALGGEAVLPPQGPEVLHFADLRLHFSPTQEESSVIGIYHFTNVSSRRVVVTGRSTCHCTVITPDREAYEPGEQGTLTAIFSIGTYGGPLVRQIPFATDHPDQPTGLVWMDLKLPPAPIIRASLLAWSLHEQPTPKTFMIILVPGFNHRFTGVHASDPAFTATLADSPTLPGYLVTVAPIRTDDPLQASIVLETDCPRTFEVFAIIRPTDSPPATK
jgi:hypothetical protein